MDPDANSYFGPQYYQTEIKGRTTIGGNIKTFKDTCILTITKRVPVKVGPAVLEYSVNNKCLVTQVPYTCRNSCINGKCRLPCDDSEDGGINYYKQAKTNGYDSVTDKNVRLKDGCLTDTKLREYYCANVLVLTYKDYDCMSEGKVCAGGRCIELSVEEP